MLFAVAIAFLAAAHLASRVHEKTGNTAAAFATGVFALCFAGCTVAGAASLVVSLQQ